MNPAQQDTFVGGSQELQPKQGKPAKSLTGDLLPFAR